MAETITVTISNWEKHNPRKDVKRPSWFSFDNRMIEDSDFFNFNHGEFKAWIYLLSRASQKHSATIELSFDHADKVCKIKKKDMRSAIEKLIKLQIVTVDVTCTSRARDVDVRDPYATNRQTDITNKQDKQTDTSAVQSTYVAVHEFVDEPDVSKFISKYQIKPETQKSWAKLYEIEFIRREVIKAFSWISANPRKEPKVGRGATSFMSSWLERSWESYRKSIPSNKPRDTSWIDEIKAEEASRLSVEAV